MIVPVSLALGRPSASAIGQARRLGTSVRGPPLRNVGANFEVFINSVKRPSQDYLEFHQKCSSARVFVFWGLVGTLSTLLIVNPPRSCYWTNWNIWRWPGNAVNYLFRAKGNGQVFLSDKKEGDQSVTETYAFLIANRRLPHEDAKAQTKALLDKHAH